MDPIDAFPEHISTTVVPVTLPDKPDALEYANRQGQVRAGIIYQEHTAKRILKCRAQPNVIRGSFEHYEQMVYHRTILEPHTVYSIPAGTNYIVLTVQKTAFGLDIIAESLLHQLIQKGFRVGDFRKKKKFHQTPYKLPPPTPIHVTDEKRPLEEKSLSFSKKRSKVRITPVIRRVTCVVSSVTSLTATCADSRCSRTCADSSVPCPTDTCADSNVTSPTAICADSTCLRTTCADSRCSRTCADSNVTSPTATCADSTCATTTCAYSRCSRTLQIPVSQVPKPPVQIPHVPEPPVQIPMSQVQQPPVQIPLVPQPPVQIPHVPEPPVQITHVPEPTVQIPVSQVPQPSLQIPHVPEPSVKILPVPEPIQILHALEPMQILSEFDTLDPLELTDAFDLLISFVFGPPAQELQLLHTVPSIFDGGLISFLDEFERAPMDLTMPRLNPCVKKSFGFKAIQLMDTSVNSCL
ncbi:uncharacterized protein TNCV_5024711 [Trichonephila clavipes]|nr:uncharacterized protein TNCV_5024711 [Trichonephila clavipes]